MSITALAVHVWLQEGFIPKTKPFGQTRVSKTMPPFAHFPHPGESDPYEYSWVIVYTGVSGHCRWMTEMVGKRDVRADAKGLSGLIRDWRHVNRLSLPREITTFLDIAKHFIHSNTFTL